MRDYLSGGKEGIRETVKYYYYEMLLLNTIIFAEIAVCQKKIENVPNATNLHI